MKLNSSRTTLSSSSRAGRVPSVDAGGFPVDPVGEGGDPVGGEGDPVGPVPTKKYMLSYLCFLVVQKDPIDSKIYLYIRITHIILIFLVRIYIHMCVLICGRSGCSSR